jgi:hypothetical protein
MSELTINSHILKLSGKAELPKEITPGHNYHVAIDGSIPKVELHDNENGTWDKVYTFKPVKIDVLDPLGETLILKDTRSQSQLFRAKLRHIYNFDKNITVDFDTFYKNIMGNLIENAAEVAEMYKE